MQGQDQHPHRVLTRAVHLDRNEPWRCVRCRRAGRPPRCTGRHRDRSTGQPWTLASAPIYSGQGSKAVTRVWSSYRRRGSRPTRALTSAWASRELASSGGGALVSYMRLRLVAMVSSSASSRTAPTGTLPAPDASHASCRQSQSLCLTQKGHAHRANGAASHRRPGSERSQGHAPMAATWCVRIGQPGRLPCRRQSRPGGGTMLGEWGGPVGEALVAIGSIVPTVAAAAAMVAYLGRDRMR